MPCPSYARGMPFRLDGWHYQNGRHNDDGAHPSSRQAASFGYGLMLWCYVMYDGMHTHSCSIWLSRTSMTGLVGLELGSRILGFADFIVVAVAEQALMRASVAAVAFHLGRLNSVIIFIIIIIFFFFFSSSPSPSSSSSPSTSTFKVADVAAR